MIEPRGMSKEQAAAYAGCQSLSAFNEWVRRGIMPRPIPGTRKWDRKAIDAALDRISGRIPKFDRSCHPTTNGRPRKMRMRLKAINSLKKLADRSVKTYVNSFGRPWTGDGFRTSWDKAFKKDVAERLALP